MFRNEHLRVALEKAVDEAVIDMKRSIQAANLVLTGEMLSSFTVGATKAVNDHISKQIDMVGYVRISDLRSRNYVRTPPIEAMEYFVKSAGVHSFYYVPGYPDGKWPSNDEIAVRRIASAIKKSFKRLPDRKRGYRGIYSKRIGKAFYALKSSARQAGLSFMLDFVKNTLEGSK